MAAYNIIGFEKTTGVITISFDEKMAPLSIEVPFTDDNHYIVGDELDAYIQGFIPTWHLERVNKIAAGIPNEDAINALVVTPELTQEQQDIILVEENLAMWQQIETEKQIAKALVKFGVIDQDPTEIPVSQL